MLPRIETCKSLAIANRLSPNRVIGLSSSAVPPVSTKNCPKIRNPIAMRKTTWASIRGLPMPSSSGRENRNMSATRGHRERIWSLLRQHSMLLAWTLRGELYPRAKFFWTEQRVGFYEVCFILDCILTVIQIFVRHRRSSHLKSALQRCFQLRYSIFTCWFDWARMKRQSHCWRKFPWTSELTRAITSVGSICLPLT